MKTLRTLTLLGVAAALALSAARAGALQGPAHTDFYVSATGGSNANDGQSPATAWRTLTHALANVPQSVGGAGTLSIHVAPGTYDAALGEVFPLSASDLSGNLASPIEIVSDAGSAATTIVGGAVAVFELEHDFMGFDTDETRIELLEGFTLIGGSAGVRLDAFGGGPLSVTLRDLAISAASIGVDARGVGDNVLAVGGVVSASLEAVHVSSCAASCSAARSSTR